MTQRLIYTGEAAARVKPGMDRRTFKVWAKKAGVEAAAIASGDYLYKEEEVDKVARYYKEAQKAKKVKK